MKRLQHITFVHPYLLHYHYPRLEHFSRYCEENQVTLSSIEIAKSDYSNITNHKSQNASFNNVVLFPDNIFDDISTKRSWESLKKKLESYPPDVLFLYGYSSGVFRRAKSWAEHQHIATVIISDSNIFDKKRHKYIEYIKSLLVSKFNAAFVGGTSSSEYLQSLGLPEDRISYGYDVVDVHFFSQRDQFNNQRLSEILANWNLPNNFFLVVARLIPEKNLPLLIEAYTSYLSMFDDHIPSWDLVICGDGPEHNSLLQTINSLNDLVKNRMHLYGYIKQPEIIDFFSSASCFVLPSKSETWGLVVNEALACGLPVIVTNRAGCAKDLVQDGISGWNFDPESSDELAALMQKVCMMDIAERKRIGQQGKTLIDEWGLERFSSGAWESAEIAVKHRDRQINKRSATLSSILSR